jgi:hypothetical protein
MTTAHSEVRQIPLAALQVSLTGPQASRRAHFAKDELGELAAA